MHGTSISGVGTRSPAWASGFVHPSFRYPFYSWVRLGGGVMEKTPGTAGAQSHNH